MSSDLSLDALVPPPPAPSPVPGPGFETFHRPVSPSAPRPRPAAAAPAGLRQRGALQEVRVSEIHPDPGNPRDDLTGIAELAESIREVGLIQPIVVRRDGDPPRLVVVAGHRRLAAIQRLGWATAQVIIRPPMRPADVLAQMIVENSHRVDLDPIEEARGLKALMVKLNATSQADLAAKVGRTQMYVSQRLALLSLPVEDQDAIRAGEMNLSDGVRRGREAAGTARAKNTTGHPHLGVDHDLASRAKARCKRLQHKKSGRNSVGGVACGACWESVIRADERQHLHEHSARAGECATCHGPYTAGEVES